MACYEDRQRVHGKPFSLRRKKNAFRARGISRSFRKLLGEVLSTVHCDRIFGKHEHEEPFSSPLFWQLEDPKKYIVAYLYAEGLYRGLLHTFAPGPIV